MATLKSVFRRGGGVAALSGLLTASAFLHEPAAAPEKPAPTQAASDGWSPHQPASVPAVDPAVRPAQFEKAADAALPPTLPNAPAASGPPTVPARSP